MAISKETKQALARTSKNYLEALNIKAGSVDAENITGDVITGKEIRGAYGEFNLPKYASSNSLFASIVAYNNNNTANDSSNGDFAEAGIFHAVNNNGTGIALTGYGDYIGVSGTTFTDAFNATGINGTANYRGTAVQGTNQLGGGVGVYGTSSALTSPLAEVPGEQGESARSVAVQGAISGVSGAGCTAYSGYFTGGDGVYITKGITLDGLKLSVDGNNLMFGNTVVATYS